MAAWEVLAVLVVPLDKDINFLMMISDVAGMAAVAEMALMVEMVETDNQAKLHHYTNTRVLLLQ